MRQFYSSDSFATVPRDKRRFETSSTRSGSRAGGLNVKLKCWPYRIQTRLGTLADFQQRKAGPDPTDQCGAVELCVSQLSVRLYEGSLHLDGDRSDDLLFARFDIYLISADLP
jgi:hypothetical protein